MVKIKQAIFGIAAAATIALLPMAPAMAGGPGFRPPLPFGLGHGIVGAAVTLATLPLVIASSLAASVGATGAPYPTQGYGAPGYGYAPPVAYAPSRPYYAPYPRYYAPRIAYGPRAYYGGHPSNTGRGYYRSGGSSYPHR